MAAQFITVDASSDNQRVDNFLFRHMKGVPKSRVYRALRQGEVRVNKKRVKAHTRLCLDDVVRIPPIGLAERAVIQKPSDQLAGLLMDSIVYQDSDCLVVDKPSGLPVHGGSGNQAGLIELFRLLTDPNDSYLELVHRLDKATSGCLVLAKNRSFLTHCHEVLAARKAQKTYQALVKGNWQGGEILVNAPLLRYQRTCGESAVRVDEAGKSSQTIFRPLQRFNDATLVEAIPVTGRTHQIRVHAAHIGHPIGQDDKYGDKFFNRNISKLGLSRLFLHAVSITFPLASSGETFGVCVPLPAALIAVLDRLN